MNALAEPLAIDLSFEEDELVVDSGQLRPVLARLAELQVGFSGIAEDDRLGLSLLTGLTGVQGSLDDLLTRLRDGFRADFGGWTPELGKHRQTVGTIGPAGPKPMVLTAGPKPMTGGVPTPATGPDKPEPAPAPDAGRGVRVGIVDTPVYRHPAFAGHDIETTTWLRRGGTPLHRRSGHGTFVSSIILSYAPAARLHVAGALAAETGGGSEWEVAQHIVRLGAEVDILNLSLASHTGDGEISLVLRRAIDRLPRHVLVIAAAGNHGDLQPPAATPAFGPKSPTWPAALPGVVAVGALDQTGVPAPFSPKAPWVDCEARGFEVAAAYPNDTGWATWSGTSFAAAVVTGAVAARTVPAVVSAREVLEQLLADGSSVVKPFEARS